MLLKDKISSAYHLMKCRLFGKRIPLAVRWHLTNRCNLKCVYCKAISCEDREFSFDEVKKGIDELCSIGTKRISFSGGEPLLRQDMKQIIEYCRMKNIYPEMNSNGTLVAENIEKIKSLDFLKMSLDGPEEAHDAVRGRGTFKKVIEAARACRKSNINFGFACTITKYNIDKLDRMVELAREFDTIVAFQPLKKIYRGLEDITALLPEKEAFRQAVKSLLQKKKGKYGKNIRNSLMGLYHISEWPRYKKLKCWAGRIFCIIDAEGNVYPCDRITYPDKLPNCRQVSIKQALASLPEISCGGCGFCGSQELNYLMSFRIKVLNSIKKILT